MGFNSGFKGLNAIQVNFIIELILHKAFIRSKITSASTDWKFRQTIFFLSAMLAKQNSSLDWQLSQCAHRSTTCMWLSKFRIFMTSSQNYAGNIRKSIIIMRKEIFATLNTRYLRGLNLAAASFTSQSALQTLAWQRPCIYCMHVHRHHSELHSICLVLSKWA